MAMMRDRQQLNGNTVGRRRCGYICLFRFRRKPFLRVSLARWDDPSGALFPSRAIVPLMPLPS
jgi:hypothetical protein